jgi:hypothetical protein
VLDGLRWAYPYRLHQIQAEPGNTVVLAITGPYTGTWQLVATGDEGDRARLGKSGDPRVLEVILRTRAIIGSPK